MSLPANIIPLDTDAQILEKILGQLDIKLSQLRDAIVGTDSRTLTDLYNIASGIKTQTDKLTFDASNYLYVRIGASDIAIGGGPAQLQVKNSSGTWTDVGYSSGDLNVPVSIQADNVGLATESTLSGIKTKTDKLTFDASSYLYVDIGADSVGLLKASDLSFDGSGYLNVNARVVANPSNLDVALSTRASENTLSTFSAKFPSATSLSDSLSNPTTTIVGSALLGWDGSHWRRVAVDSSSRLRSVVESLPSLPSGTNIIGGVFADSSYSTSINQQVGTTEVVGSAVDVSRRGRKVIFMKNTQDVSVTLTIEGSYNGSDWYTVRSGITLNAGDTKIGALSTPFAYVRARAVASASPTTGSVVVTIFSMT